MQFVEPEGSGSRVAALIIVLLFVLFLGLKVLQEFDIL